MILFLLVRYIIFLTFCVERGFFCHLIKKGNCFLNLFFYDGILNLCTFDVTPLSYVVMVTVALTHFTSFHQTNRHRCLVHGEVEYAHETNRNSERSNMIEGIFDLVWTNILYRIL